MIWMDYKETLILEIVEYILSHAEKNTMTGKARDSALVLASDISSEISAKVLEEFKKRNGNGKEKKTENH